MKNELSCKFQTFCQKARVLFKKHVSKINFRFRFLAILPFLDPIFTNFLPQSAWSLEKFEKSADFLFPVPFFQGKKANFQNFLPQSAWSLENFEKSADLGPLPAEIPRKLIGHFLEIFEKLAKKGQILPTFCQNNKVY